MRRLSGRLVAALELPDCGIGLLRTVGKAVEQVRGRPVRLHAVAFPPDVASGLWVNRATHDIIAYEMHTDLEHQLVIIGHEVWHMFEGHCGSLTAHGAAASRALDKRTASAVQELMASIPDINSTDISQSDQMDISLHVALRADTIAIRQEEEAELFGIRFATHMQAALDEARLPADLGDLAGRIRASMTHRIRHS
ncbi:hypothetical protein AB0G83_32190 [Streptomyces klenkii]|uniref:hypothetical protein n=1 Tax=Streptomyces klenkii TaxID=1420899 RepID=UPI0033F7AABB